MKETHNKTLINLNSDIIHNFDVSVIMSFYKRYDEFEKVLPRNAPFFQRNGIEVIIVMDEPSEKEKLLSLIKEYPFINWKILVNEQPHPPRNHAPVLNVGLKHATKKYILQIDPEVEHFTDIIAQMRYAVEHYPRHYIIATMAYIHNEMELTSDIFHTLDFIPWGNLMVEKKYLEELNGYDETFLKWGGEDNNMRARLDMLGIQKLTLYEALTIHREVNYSPRHRAKLISKHTLQDWHKMHYPISLKVNSDGWGNEFNKIIYDWENNQYAEELCSIFLKQFINFEIKDSEIFKIKYKKILLCQAHNEEDFITDFLKHMANYFDGIILLDDESIDSTWELSKHQKILLKVKKKRFGFNDLENRNILLDLASFFKTDWFCFMDIDERFDKSFVDFASFESDKSIQVVGFRAVYLWNNEQIYKGDVPYSKDGILKVYRMFRPIGHTQINTSKKLHFIACPYYTHIFNSNILFKDYGCLKENQRKKNIKDIC